MHQQVLLPWSLLWAQTVLHWVMLEVQLEFPQGTECPWRSVSMWSVKATSVSGKEREEQFLHLPGITHRSTGRATTSLHTTIS